MNPSHKKIIYSNIETLINRTDVVNLLPKLVEKGVFLENMVLKYMGGTDHDLKRDLYLTILTRGPEAFKNLVSALHDTGHYSLATLLDPEVSMPRPSRRVHPSHLAKYLMEDPNRLIHMKEFAEKHPNSHVNLSTNTFQIKVQNSTKAIDSSSQFKTTIYQMTSNPKGCAMIINIKKYNNDIEEERIGAEHDEKSLEILFRQLGYTVIIYRDLTGKDMVEKLRNFAQAKDHTYVDSCILAILCHGEKVGGESYFVAADGERVGINSVLELFSNENCQRLSKKPKIFFFQSCRGDRKVHGISKEFTRTRTDGAGEIPLRTYSDMLIAYATVNGFKSHRDMHLGTWFIQAICEVFMKHACDTEIMEMLKMVDCKLENLVSEKDTMQTTSFENRGFKTFFFNPGIYDDEEDVG